MGADRRSWKLIIADDSPEDRADVRQLLLMGAERRYQFHEAETAAATCQAILEPNAGMPACLILDYHLPDAEALEVIQNLMGRRGIPICPIVVITGSSRGNVGTLAICAGAQDFVGKNWMTPESLTRAIENAVSRWKMARSMAVHLGVVEILATSREENVQLANSLQLIGEELHWHAGAVWLVDPDRKFLRCHHVWQHAGTTSNVHLQERLSQTQALGDGLAGQVWAQKKSTFWDAESSPEGVVESEWLIRSGFLSASAFPILNCGDCLGIIELYCRSPVASDFDLADTFEAIGNQIGLAIERTRAERKIRENEEQLRKVIHYYDFFIGVLGHDLRNPLAAILTGAELGLHLATEDKSKDLWRRIKNSGQRMQRLIEQLLDVTRIRSGGGLALQYAPTNLAELTRITIDELTGLHCQARIDLKIEGNAAGEWDADRLAQVLSNLIGNAAQHATGTHPIDVQITATHPDLVEFAVHNEGTIAIDVLPTLFDPFVKGPKGPNKGGLGLGLYISQQIILAHGGRISVQSDALSGTTFQFFLPRRLTQPTDTAKIAIEPIQPSSANTANS